MNEFWSVSTLANHLGVSVSTVRQWVRTGALQASQVVPGGKLRIADTDVRVMMERSKKKVRDTPKPY
ncbi:MAG: helix-turn-helix domain-containing protein [Patescibacteria group bacterium]|nr:helix-turn-helix domain-containing protein [Patescibacteria group bacterium]